MIPAKDKQTFLDEVERYYGIYKEEYRVGDPDLIVTFEPWEEAVSEVFTKEAMDRVIDFGVFCENGILRMCRMWRA